jgi:molybdopterin-containing oxidoreductase family iron-sulfur binding subunit
MSEPNHKSGFHSFERMQEFKDAALPTHSENFDVPDEVSRRGILKAFMGASTALALGVPGCARKPKRKIVSRAAGPEYMKPGEAVYYSSAYTDGPFPYGIVIKTVDGRPVKIEGNPDDPISLGASNAQMQASLLSLYDPDRLQSPLKGDKQITWDQADTEIVDALKNASSAVLITRSTLGPSEQALVDDFKRVSGKVKHFVHEPIHDGARRSAWTKLYGQPGEWVPQFDKAKIIVSFDSDFMATDGADLENIRRFAAGRKLNDAEHGSAEMSRLYQFESALTVTGSNADHRIRTTPSAILTLATSLLKTFDGPAAPFIETAAKLGMDEHLMQALVHDLKGHMGQSLVVAGPHLPEAVHACVALLNHKLNTIHRLPRWNPPWPMQWSAISSRMVVSDPEEITSTLEAGADVLICLGVNPVYDWPGGGFKDLIDKAKLSVGHGLYQNETLSACDIALPSHHNLESWNDAQPRIDVTFVCQPVIAPLFDTRQEAESLLRWTQALAKEQDPIGASEDFHAYVQNRWGSVLTPSTQPVDRHSAWEKLLSKGVLFASQIIPMPKLDDAAAEQLAQMGNTSSRDACDLVILPHHGIYDGRFSNNAWLQELPHAVTKLVWDNAAVVSPATAEQYGLSEGDEAKIQVADKMATLPVLVQPGTSDDVIVVTLGHGRTAGGRIATAGGGTNVAALIGAGEAARLATNVTISKAGSGYKLVRTQKKFAMDDRGYERAIALDGTLGEYRHEADFVKHKRHLPEMVDMYDAVDYSQGHKWAMSIDLNACVGCNACSIACQAENNIPVVGKDECGLGREMSWLRLDQYRTGDEDNPTIHHQPMLCQHCDNAPCENVCPVNATVHNAEGLNEMVYNRCVGTRYCSNNCPYKVRRFNYLRYQDAQLHDPVQELMFNPQVTVRGVGVMEKCTFCVQRINAAKFAARDNGDAIPDGTIKTACEQACPAQAIVFGDVNDPDGQITKQRDSQRAYHVLEELNIKPNVTYLAKVRNPAIAKNTVPGPKQHGRPPKDEDAHG